jgi:hypothetical protein
MVSTKRLIVEDVNETLRKLTNKELASLPAGSARLVYGEKGSGKSSALTLATLASWLAFDNVVPIYLHYAGDAKNFQSPSAALSVALGLPSDTPLQESLQQLGDRDLHALIIVDEIEQVYSGTDHADQRQRVLNDLQLLSSQTTRHAFTYICSNSAFAPLLLQGKKTKPTLASNLSADFPLLARAPALEVSEFPALVVHRAINTSKDFTAVLTAYEADEVDLRTVYTFYGSSLTTMERICGTAFRLGEEAERTGATTLDASQAQVIGAEFLRSADCTDTRAILVQHRYKPLIAALREELVEENLETVRDELMDKPVDWLRDQRPLQASALRALVSAHHPDAKDDWKDIIRRLVDTGYFSAAPDVSSLLPNRPKDLNEAYLAFVKANPWESWQFLVRSKAWEWRQRIEGMVSPKSP